MPETLKILMLEDSHTDAEIVHRLLKKEKIDFEFSLAMNKDGFVRALDHFHPTVILADNSLPQFDAREALKIVNLRSLRIPFILVTGSVSEEFAVDIIKLGADDYILKDRLTRLPNAIEAAIKQQRAENEKRDALEDLKRSEEKYRTLFERNLAGVYQITVEGRILNCNDAFAQMMGYGSFAELMLQNAFSLFSTESGRDRLLGRLLKEGHLTNYETVVNHKDGRLVHIIQNVSFQTDSHTGERLIEGVMIDITERKKAEEELRRFNERVQTLSKATKDAVWDWDLQTDEVWWNESFYNLLGYPPEEPVPPVEEWTKRLHPADREKILNRLRDLRESDLYSWEDEFRFELPGGAYGTVLGRAYVLRNDSGEPVRAMGAFMDLTEQKRLMKEMEVLSMIAKETSNAVVIFDRKSGQVGWVNEGFTRHTGYSLQEMRGRNPSGLLQGPETDTRSLAHMLDRIANDLPYSGDILIYTKEGEARWHYVSGQPIWEDNGEVMNYFVISTDISERRRMEEERLTSRIEQQKEITRMVLQTQEMERNELGRELHDNINQILASVYLKLGYYLEEPENNIDLIDNCRENLKKAIQEARNLSHHMVMPSFSEKSLREELRQLIDNYSYKNIVRLDVTKMNEKNFPATLKETLFRIVQEQLSNIYKHAKADKVLIQLHTDPGMVTLLIRDNGIGFDTQQIRKGIGITNIYNRASTYNGKAVIESQAGEGCTLIVTIPAPG